MNRFSIKTGKKITNKEYIREIEECSDYWDQLALKLGWKLLGFSNYSSVLYQTKSGASISLGLEDVENLLEKFDRK